MNLIDDKQYAPTPFYDDVQICDRFGVWQKSHIGFLSGKAWFRDNEGRKCTYFYAYDRFYVWYDQYSVQQVMKLVEVFTAQAPYGWSRASQNVMRAATLAPISASDYIKDTTAPKPVEHTTFTYVGANGSLMRDKILNSWTVAAGTGGSGGSNGGNGGATTLNGVVTSNPEAGEPAKKSNIDWLEDQVNSVCRGLDTGLDKILKP